MNMTFGAMVAARGSSADAARGARAENEVQVSELALCDVGEALRDVASERKLAMKA